VRRGVARQGEVLIDEGRHPVTTDLAGRYRQYLAPGSYTVRANFPDYPASARSCPAVLVSVSNSQRPERVDLRCDLSVP
jgi:hypothetical protein